MQRIPHPEPSVFHDLVLGAIAGAGAAWAMNQANQAMNDRVPSDARRRAIAARPDGVDTAHVIANKAAAAVGVELDPQQTSRAGTAVHYGLGAGMGALYSVLRDRVPLVDSGHGTGFGLMIFALQDAGMDAALSDTGRPVVEPPWQDHARGFVAHGFFGFVLDAVLRVLGPR